MTGTAALPGLIVNVRCRAIFEDGMQFVALAAQALSRDEFSKCFEPQPISQPRSRPLFAIYLVGWLIRYCVLLPIRLSVLLLATLLFTSLLPLCYVSHNAGFTRWLFRNYCRVWLLSFSAVIRHHGRKADLLQPHLFVANHTSFIDYLLLSSHAFPHATVAQIHGGLFGWFQRWVLALNGSLAFDRGEQADRVAVTKKMQAHISQRSQRAPLVIFPEGTCVNNDCTVLFHKGAFELDATICPVAIKYNKRLLDPYWNSREQTFTQHVLYLMTRWFMVADVWWLPPMKRRPKESAIDFANRTKGLISQTAGLKNLSWDGYMKNCMSRYDCEKMRRSSQQHYVSTLRRRGLTPANSGGGSVQQQQPLPAMTIGGGREQGRLDAASPSSAITKNVPHLPSWLSDVSVIKIKNELLLADSRACDPSLQLLSELQARKDDISETWRHYSRLTASEEGSGVGGGDDDDHLMERRMENSAWRFWFKQQLRDAQSGPGSR